MEDDEEKFVYEEVAIEEDSDDNENFEEVPEEEEEPDEDASDEDEFKDMLKSVKNPVKTTESKEQKDVVVQKRPTVIDDFFRNFLTKTNMRKSLETFQAEWYEMQAKGLLNGQDSAIVPDIYLRNDSLDNENRNLKQEVEHWKAIAEKAKSTWDKLRKERDFHRMHHRRVVQEKNKLILDMKRLKNHYASYEPALKQLKDKYEHAMKDKMLARLEKEKLTNKIEALQQQLAAMEEAHGNQEKKEEAPKPKKRTNDSALPADDRVNPFANTTFDVVSVQSFSLQKTFKGHSMAISGMALHPRKPILATVSDDTSWKLWSVPNGELIMSGDGHRDWVASCDFHPRGTCLATASGDGTVKVWDFARACCAATFSDHTQAVWGVAFHDGGDFLVSCSMDHTSKLWDLNSQRCRQTFRGHVDSVNAVCLQPFSNVICTASGDKTVSLWDLRSALCIQTFYGHRNAVNHVNFNLKGDSIVSSDADGIIKVWDVRMVGERAQIQTGSLRHPINETRFDRSGQILASASDDGSIKIFNALTGEHLGDLQGHTDSVQSLVFDPQGRYLISAGSDHSFRIWS